MIYRARSRSYRGKVWLELAGGGGRWSALRTLKRVRWADQDAARRATGGADWRDYQGEAVLEGVKPAPGMYLIHRGRRIVYGKILRVTTKGAVVWHGELCDVTTMAATLHAGGYSYADHPPEGFSFHTLKAVAS